MMAAGSALKSGVIDAVKDAYDVEVEVIRLVENSISRSVGAAGDVVVTGIGVARGIAVDTMGAMEEVASQLISSTTNLTRTFISGIADVGGEVMGVANRATKMTLKTAAEMGPDAALALEKAGRSIVFTMRDAGVKVEDVGKGALLGAVSLTGAAANAALGTAGGLLRSCLAGTRGGAATALPKPREGRTGTPPSR